MNHVFVFQVVKKVPFAFLPGVPDRTVLVDSNLQAVCCSNLLGMLQSVIVAQAKDFKVVVEIEANLEPDKSYV